MLPAFSSLGDDAGRLAELRAELDAIDDALLELLTRRAGLVQAVAGRKAAVGRLRPGREAAIVRRLLGQTRAPLPAEMVVRMWRELFAGSIAMQGRFGVVAVTGVEALARAHFGLATPVQVVADAAAALALVDGHTVAVVPTGAGWWMDVAAAGRRVMARLPFWGAQPGEAYVVGDCMPDGSGQDCSLVAWPDGDVEGVVVERAGGRVLVCVDGLVEAVEPPALLIGAYARPVGE